MEETDPAVTDLANELANYEHLQHLNLSKNAIKDIQTIGSLQELLSVNCSTNAVADIKFLLELAGSDRLQFLQVGQFSNTVTVSFFLLAPRFERKQNQRALFNSPAKTILVESESEQNHLLR